MSAPRAAPACPFRSEAAVPGGRSRGDDGAVYVPSHFAPDPDDVRQILARPGAADLVTGGPDGPEATLLPLVHDERRGVLEGHLARRNDHWTRIDGARALVIVRGPDFYVSPSWYASTAEHGRVVPTWNYVAVHVRGTVTVFDDADRLAGSVRRLTDLHETGLPRPWSVDDAPAGFVDGMLRGIVGVEVAVESVEAKLKLGQNRPPADVDGMVAGLRSVGDTAAAATVQAYRR